MARRRGKTIKALKKRIAAEAAEVAENKKSHSKQEKDEPPPTQAKKRPRKDHSLPRMTIKEALQIKKAKDEGTLCDAVAQEGPILTSCTSLSIEEQNKYVGLDCEMVGTGTNGKTSVLARACMVDFQGDIIYDAFVKVDEHITDFRTQFSGVRPKNLKSKEAVSFEECCEEVAKKLKGKILVGHALHNDLKVLLLSHPRHSIRDTAKYRPLMRFTNGKFRPKKLRDIAKEHLNMIIQGGEHTPDEDAKAAMFLYRAKRDQWENSLNTSSGGKKIKKRNLSS